MAYWIKMLNSLQLQSTALFYNTKWFFGLNHSIPGSFRVKLYLSMLLSYKLGLWSNDRQRLSENDAENQTDSEVQEKHCHITKTIHMGQRLKGNT